MTMDECNSAAARKRMEQFRATRTWNVIVSAVRDEMPVGRRRKGFRIYENCFTGDEAVSWTVEYLEQHRDLLLASADSETTCKVAITREKATRFLQKLVEQKLIEDVRRRSDVFRDSCWCVYTFNKDSVSTLPTYKMVSPTCKDSGRVHKNRNGSLRKVSIPLWHEQTRYDEYL